MTTDTQNELVPSFEEVPTEKHPTLSARLLASIDEDRGSDLNSDGLSYTYSHHRTDRALFISVGSRNSAYFRKPLQLKVSSNITAFTLKVKH